MPILEKPFFSATRLLPLFVSAILMNNFSSPKVLKPNAHTSETKCVVMPLPCNGSSMKKPTSAFPAWKSISFKKMAATILPESFSLTRCVMISFLSAALILSAMCSMVDGKLVVAAMVLGK